MNKLLTISVAAYNLETMIEDNLKSFEKCKYKDKLEVIVTDDGSTDNTSTIVQKYVDKYPNTFKLIKQKNSGAGSTVNSGIKNATGKYFKMIDGDDWVVSENLDKLLEKLETTNSDLILTNMQVYNESIKKITHTEKVNIVPCINEPFSEVCKNLSLNMHYVTYRTNILQDNNICLDNGFYTDVEYLLLPVPFIKTVDFYDLDIYVYRIARKGQSMSIASRQKHLDMHDLVLKRLLCYYNSLNDIDNNYKEYMKNRLACMMDVQLGTILSFDSNTTKSDAIKFNKTMKTLCNDVYLVYSKKIKCKILRYSNYGLTQILSKIFVKKNS